MKVKQCFAVLLLFKLCIGKPYSDDQHPASPTKPNPTEPFGNVRQLDSVGNYWLFWKTNDTHITFETHVKTRGYVGFGLTNNGKMFPADVVVGWVESNGKTVFKDCHTTGHYAPLIDTSQDWFLLNGKEDDFGTVLTFTRKLDTCDDNDFHITDNTVKVIWSYHPEDPSSFDSLEWHGVDSRGAKSTMFLSSVPPNEYVPPRDAAYFDMLHSKFQVPAKETTYQCKLFKVPFKDTKHHMIRYEPVIQSGHENIVHHILVYNCPDATDADIGATFECYETRPTNLKNCADDVIIGWAIGGVAYDFPYNAGFPFNSPGDPQYLVMEVHYNNPTYRTDVIDSSGLRITGTPTLRQYDAGMMMVGALVNTLQFIPPFEKEFKSVHYCNRECLEKALETPTNSIKIIGIMLHSHYLGRAMKVRHIRGDQELEPLTNDETYDYNYQDMRFFPKEKEVKYGDSLIAECTYDSTARTEPTLGGLPSSAEMCIAFTFYYPKTKISNCLSMPLYEQISSDPFHAVDEMYSWNWKDKNVKDKFNGILQNSTYFHGCWGTQSPPEKDYTDNIFPIREPTKKYIPPPRQCETGNFCSGKADGLYRDPSACNYFYQCASEQTYREPCSRGLVFSTKDSVCDYPYKVPECFHYHL